MEKKIQRVISLLLVVTFLFGQIAPAYTQPATNNLAPSLANDPDINPGRSKSVKNDIAHDASPGAIGNGTPFIDFIGGKIPPQIEITDNTRAQLYEKLHSAIEIAMRRYAEKAFEIPPEHRDRVAKTIFNMSAVQMFLATAAYLFEGIIDGPEDYLIGFHRGNRIGLDTALIERLTPERLAIYISHECTPEHLKMPQEGEEVDRTDHRVVYRDIQPLIFGKEEVLGLKQDLRQYITERVGEVQPQPKKAPVDIGSAFTALEKAGLFLDDRERPVAERGLREGVCPPEQLPMVVTVVRDLDLGEKGLSRAFELAETHKTQPILVAQWLDLEAHTGHVAGNIARWSKELNEMLNPKGAKWEDIPAGQQDYQREIISVIARLMDVLEETREESGIVSSDLNMRDLIRLYVALGETGSLPFISQFEEIVGAIANIPLSQYEWKIKFPYSHRVNRMIKLIEKLHTAPTLDHVYTMIEEGEKGVEEDILREYGGKEVRDAEAESAEGEDIAGGMLLSGRGLTLAQHDVVNIVISQYFTPSPLSVGPTAPPEISPDDYRALDPEGKLRAAGAKIYRLDGLNARIRAIAVSRNVAFEDQVVIHPGTFKGREKHLFIDGDLLSCLRNLSEGARKEIANHEYLHLCNIAQKESEVKKAAPIDAPLAELRDKAFGLVLQSALNAARIQALSPAERESAANGLLAGRCSKDELIHVADVGRECQDVKDPVKRALVLVEHRGIRAALAAEIVAIANECGKKKDHSYPLRVYKWASVLTRSLYGKDMRLKDLAPETQAEITSGIDCILKFYHDNVMSAKKERDIHDNMRVMPPTVMGLLRLYAVLYKRSSPKEAGEIFNSVADAIMNTPNTAAAARIWPVFHVNRQIAVVKKFMRRTNAIPDEDTLETLLREGPKAAMDVYLEQFGKPPADGVRRRFDDSLDPNRPFDRRGSGILASGKDLTIDGHTVVNEAIGTYFRGKKTPPTMSAEQLAILDPDGILAKNNIKVYALEGLNEKARSLAAKRGVEFDDIVIMHPGTFKGKERHIFIDSFEVPRLLALPSNLRTLAVMHEVAHVEDIRMKEAMVRSKYPIAEVLSELGYNPRHNSDLGLRLTSSRPSSKTERLVYRFRYGTDTAGISQTKLAGMSEIDKKMEMLSKDTNSLGISIIEIVSGASAPFAIKDGALKIDEDVLSCLDLKEFSALVRFCIIYNRQMDKICGDDSCYKEAAALYYACAELVKDILPDKYPTRPEEAAETVKGEKTTDILMNAMARLKSTKRRWKTNDYERLFGRLNSVAHSEKSDVFGPFIRLKHYDANHLDLTRIEKVLGDALQLHRPDGIFAKTLLAEWAASDVFAAIEDLDQHHFFVPYKDEVIAFARGFSLKKEEASGILSKASNIFLLKEMRLGHLERVVTAATVLYDPGAFIESLRESDPAYARNALSKSNFHDIPSLFDNASILQRMFGVEASKRGFWRLSFAERRFVIETLSEMIKRAVRTEEEGRHLTALSDMEYVKTFLSNDSRVVDAMALENEEFLAKTMCIFLTLERASQGVIPGPVSGKDIQLREETLRVMAEMKDGFIQRFGVAIVCATGRSIMNKLGASWATDLPAAIERCRTGFETRLAALAAKNTPLTAREREAAIYMNLNLQIGSRDFIERQLAPLDEIDFGRLLASDLSSRDQMALEKGTVLYYLSRMASLAPLSRLFEHIRDAVVEEGRSGYSFVFACELLKNAASRAENAFGVYRGRAVVEDENARQWKDLIVSVASHILTAELMANPNRSDVKLKTFFSVVKDLPWLMRAEVIRAIFPDYAALDRFFSDNAFANMKAYILAAMDLEEVANYVDSRSQTMDVEQIIRFAPASLETQLRAKMDTLKSAKSSIAFNRMDYKRRVTAYPQTVESYDGVKVPNHYAILGIPRQASLAEIKKSYRLLAMAYHPDRFQHEGEAARKEAEEEFKKITESYSVLSDQEKRVAYDSKLPKYHHLYPDEVWFKDFERRSDIEAPQQSIDVSAVWEKVESRLKQYQFVTPQTVVAMLAEEIGLEKDQIGRGLRQVSTVLKEYTAKDGELEGYYAARNDILDRSVKDLGLNLAERKLLAKALFDPRLRAEDIAASKDKASAAEGAAALSDTDIKYRAAIFKTNLIRVLSQNPDKIFVLAIDSDIGSDAKNEIQPTIFKAIDELREIKKPDGTPLLANLRVVRGIGQGLVGQIKNETTEFGNVFIVAKQDNLDQRDCYNEIKGKAWITAINDTAVGKLNYLPVFEAAALTIMTALGADSEAIGRFYTAIADGPIDPAKIAEMRDRRIIYLIPKAMKFDTEKTLRDFNEMVARIHMSA